LIRRIHQAAEAFTRAQKKHNEKLQEQWSSVGSELVSVDAEAEWNYFSNPEAGRIVDPQIEMRDAQYLSFPEWVINHMCWMLSLILIGFPIVKDMSSLGQ